MRFLILFVLLVGNCLGSVHAWADHGPVLTEPARIGPALTGPKRIGVRPDTPINHAIGVAGLVGARKYSAENLPAGLSLNATTGVIVGTAPEAGTYNVSISVQGANDATVTGTLQIESGALLAMTPPMGFNSWNCFEKNASSQMLSGVADAMVSSGMRDAGYQYVNIDDCWSKGRDANSRLIPDPTRFPDTRKPGNGMQELAAKIHACGLRIGIYSDAGSKTCAGYAGTLGHEVLDAQTFAGWGIDYVKHDYCNAPKGRATAVARYTAFGQALKKSGRSIVFSVTEWGQRKPWEWASDPNGAAAQLWRTSFDMRDEWDFDIPVERSQRKLGVMDAADLQAGLEQYNGPGGWNDPDMMVVGVDLAGSSGHLGAKGLNYTQERAHFSLWAMWSSPLLLNADLRKLDPDHVKYDATWAKNILPIITNHEVIAINQDPLGKQAQRVVVQGGLEVWQKELANGDIAVALVNRSAGKAVLTVDFKTLKIEHEWSLRDLWRQQDLGVESSALSASLAGYETVLLRLAPKYQGDVDGDGMVGQSDLDYLYQHLGKTVLISSLRAGDVDGDGVVGQADIRIVLHNIKLSQQGRRAEDFEVRINPEAGCRYPVLK